MRFAAVNVPKQLPAQRTSATEVLRRIVAGEPLVQALPARQPELPAELDQRVRLVGEW